MDYIRLFWYEIWVCVCRSVNKQEHDNNGKKWLKEALFRVFSIGFGILFAYQPFFGANKISFWFRRKHTVVFFFFVSFHINFSYPFAKMKGLKIMASTSSSSCGDCCYSITNPRPTQEPQTNKKKSIKTSLFRKYLHYLWCLHQS